VDHRKAIRVGCRPPAPLGLGEPNRTLRCLTPSVARRCYRESSVLSRSPQALAVFRREALGYPPCQSQTPCCLVRATRTLDPGRLQPARCSALQPSETNSHALDVHA
jgi:hypothetical protein